MKHPPITWGRAFEVCDQHETKAQKELDRLGEPKLRDPKQIARTKAYWQGYFEGAMNVKHDLTGGPTTPIE